MPVSPQDFALWSDLTGNPYPRTPAEQMALAPEVYSFTRNLGRKGGTNMSPLRRAVDVVGKTALGLGALAGAAYLGKQFLGGEDNIKETTVEDLGTSKKPGITGKDFLESRVQSKPEVEEVVYRRDRPRNGTIEEDVYAPRLTRGELTSAYPTELSQAESRQPANLVAGETYQSSGTSSPQIASALVKAIGNIPKAGGKVTPARTPYPQLSEAEKESLYSEAGSYGPYEVGREHTVVSERAKQFISRLTPGFTKLEVDNEAPVLPPTVATAGADPLSQAARVSQDVTPPTTAQRYGQNIISGQTAVTQEAKGLSPIKPIRTPIEAKPVTQSEVISGQQSFSPGSELEMVGEDSAQKAAAFRKSAAYAAMQKQYPGLQDIESPSQPASTAPVVIKDVNVGEALRSKGLTLGGSGGDVYVSTPGGRDLQIFHPYAEHSKPGIRQTALAEQNEARELLASAGVTPEAAKNYWGEKIAGGTESPIAAMSTPAAAPVTAKVEQVSGPTASEIRDTDALLLRSMGNLSPEQRAAVRDKLLSDKYKSTPQVEPQPQVMTEFKKQGIDVSPEVAGAVTAKYLLSQLPSQPSKGSSVSSAPSTPVGPSPESVRFARETARGMSRMGLMAQREAGRARVAERAEFGGVEPMSSGGEEPRELADPRVMREMMRRQAPVATPRFF